MGRKRDNLYAVILEGLRQQLNDDELRQHIGSKVENVTDRQIVRATLLGFADTGLKEEELIQRVAAVAVKYRVSEVGHAASAEKEPAVPIHAATEEQNNEPARTESSVAMRQRKSAGGKRSKPRRAGGAS